MFTCEYCPPQKGPKIFNRFDNYRSHVILHTKRPSTSTKRTNYHPAAAAHLAALEAQMKVRNKKPAAGAASSSTATAAGPSKSTAAASSPTPSSSSDATVYTPGSSQSCGSVEATPLTAAQQRLGRLRLEASRSPAV